ncbi:hypothetical protein BHM03_00051112 [Ensete ventricosum]|nr:hypothetical protein BHM03_00051112 [Ensete ventricosum]
MTHRCPKCAVSRRGRTRRPPTPDHPNSALTTSVTSRSREPCTVTSTIKYVSPTDDCIIVTDTHRLARWPNYLCDPIALVVNRNSEFVACEPPFDRSERMSKVVYEGWMVRYGRRKIGRSFIHMRYFVLETRVLAYYKRKPQDNVVPQHLVSSSHFVLVFCFISSYL